MPIVRGCNLPDELLYDVDNNIWYREQPDGTVKVGITAVAAAMAGPLVAFTPRKAGRKVEAGMSCATLESGKWVGPAKMAFDGEVAGVNEDLVATPGTVNTDPYDRGWMVLVKPADWAAAKAKLTPGNTVAAPYETKMAADGFAGCKS